MFQRANSGRLRQSFKLEHRKETWKFLQTFSSADEFWVPITYVRHYKLWSWGFKCLQGIVLMKLTFYFGYQIYNQLYR